MKLVKLKDSIEVPFFRALVSNSMMSLTKSFFKLTAYMKDDQEFGDFGKLSLKNINLPKMLLKISGFKSLMENEYNKLSIQTRKGVLPLITIQQYSLQKIQKIISKGESKDLKTYQKIVTRSYLATLTPVEILLNKHNLEFHRKFLKNALESLV